MKALNLIEEAEMRLFMQAIPRAWMLIVCCLVVLVLSCACVWRAGPTGFVASPCTAEAIWQNHMVVLNRALRDQDVDSYDLGRALAFFWETTGIPSRARLMYGGFFLDEHAEEDLRRWNEWYEKNATALVFDSYTGRVLVDEDAELGSERASPSHSRYRSEPGMGRLSYQLEVWPEEEFPVSVVLLDGEHVATVFRREKGLELTIYHEELGRLTMKADELEYLLTEVRKRMLD